MYIACRTLCEVQQEGRLRQQDGHQQRVAAAAETLGALEPAGLPAPDRLEGVAIINGAVLNFMRAELANIDEVIDCVVSPSITGRLW